MNELLRQIPDSWRLRNAPISMDSLVRSREFQEYGLGIGKIGPSDSLFYNSMGILLIQT
jgi:hypothetical protein